MNDLFLFVNSNIFQFSVFSFQCFLYDDSSLV
jgi:hypothetical protein